LQVLDLHCGWNRKHFLKDNEEKKNSFTATVLNSFFGWSKKSVESLLLLTIEWDAWDFFIDLYIENLIQCSKNIGGDWKK
jgi:hypothetical protein